MVYKKKGLSSFHGFFMVKIKNRYIKFPSHHDDYGEEPAYVHGENVTYDIFSPYLWSYFTPYMVKIKGINFQNYFYWHFSIF